MREIALNQMACVYFATSAITTLQEEAEADLTHLFEDANMCAIHGMYRTITTREIHLTCHINGKTDIYHLLTLNALQYCRYFKDH